MITCTFEDGGNAKLRHVVVHAIVEKDGKLLLVKRATTLSLEGGKWALPGGFLERGETAGEAALRELKEEAGWTGEVIGLFRINTNPNRPHEDRQNIAIDVLIRPIGQVGEMDNESTALDWLPMGQLPPLESLAFDHGETIQLYLEWKQKKHTLPITS